MTRGPVGGVGGGCGRPDAGPAGGLALGGRGVVVMAQACAPAAAHTIGDAPDLTPASRGPGAQGGPRVLPHGEAPALCDDGRLMSTSPTFDARRPSGRRRDATSGARPATPSRASAASPPAWPGTWRARAVGARGVRADGRAERPGRGALRRPVDGAAHRRTVRRAAPGLESASRRGAGPVAYAASSTPAQRSRWRRWVSACSS